MVFWHGKACQGKKLPTCSGKGPLIPGREEHKRICCYFVPQLWFNSMQPKCLHNKPLILLLLSLPLLWFSCQESNSPPQVEKDNSRMETPAGAYAYIKAQKRLPFEI